MRRILVSLVMAVFVVSALVEAQVGGGVGGGYTSSRVGTFGPFDPNAPRHDVSGTVVNAITGEPIARAIVQVMGPQQQSDFTDAEGNFRFAGMYEGRTVFIARKPGYFNSMELTRGAMLSSINVSGDMPPLVLKLTPEGVVTGTITGDDGEPLEGVRLRFRHQVINNGRKQWEDRRSATSNEDGEFRAAELPPGAYYVLAEEARPPRIGDSGPAYGSTYYPGVSDISSAAAINVQGGQVVRLDFRLRAQTVFQISGAVLGIPPGRPAQVRLTSVSGEPLGVGVHLNPRNATFDAKIAAGAYVLRAWTRDDENRILTGASAITVAGSLSNLRLVLQPAVSIPVVVKTEFSKTQASQAGGVAGSISPRRSGGPPQYVSVTASKVDGDRLNPFTMMQPLGDNGSFGLSNVEPGRYTLRITPNGPWYVQSATLGQTDLLRDELVVAPGGEAGAIEIVVRDDGGSISGSVMSDNTPVNAMVLAVPDRDRSSVIPPPQGASERSGFHLNWLAPGDYLLFAFDSVDGLEYGNREALDSYTSRVTRVSVAGNGTANVTLTLIKRGEP